MKLTNAIFVIAVIAALFPVTLLAAENVAVQPFGSMLWSDGILDAIEKVNNIGGLDKFELSIGKSRVSLKDAVSKDSIADAVSGILNSEYPSLQRDIQTGFGDFTHSYLNDKGNTVRLLDRQCFLEAFPIVIAGVPFTLTVNFKNMPGYAIQKPEKTIILENGKVALPLVIFNVELKSSSPKLTENLSKLDKLLLEKYQIYEGYVNGNNHASVQIIRSTEEYRIIYDARQENEALQVFENVYRSHLSKLETKDLGKKPEMGSGL